MQFKHANVLASSADNKLFDLLAKIESTLTPSFFSCYSRINNSGLWGGTTGSSVRHTGKEWCAGICKWIGTFARSATRQPILLSLTSGVKNHPGFIANVRCQLILFGEGSAALGEGKGESSASTSTVNWQNQPFMETRRLIVLRCWGFWCEPRCVTLLSLKRRINAQPLIKNARTPDRPGVGTTGVKS